MRDLVESVIMNRDGRRYGTVTANIPSNVSGGATGAWRNVTFRDVKEGWKKKANEPYLISRASSHTLGSGP